MKKRRIFAAIIALAMTSMSFAGVPVSAQAVEAPESFTETAPSATDFEPAVTTVQTTAPAAVTTCTTTAAPTETEPVIKDTVPENGFRLTFIAVRNIPDEEYQTGIFETQVKDVNMHLERIPVEFDEDYGYLDIGEPEHLADWNTSDAKEFCSEIYVSDTKYRYHVYSDDLENRYYVDHGGDAVDMSFFGGDKEYYCHFYPNLYPERQYPLVGTYSRTIRLVDIETGEPVQGLECELYDPYAGETIYTWNSTDEPEVTISGLKYELEDPWHTKGGYFIMLRNKGYQEWYFENNSFAHHVSNDDVARLTFKQTDYKDGDINIDETIKMYFVEHIDYGFTERPMTTTSGASGGTTTTTTTTVTTGTFFTGTHAYPDTGETTVPTTPVKGSGDANCDGAVTIADAAAVLQYLGNADKYPLTQEGRQNADCDGEAGLTTNDSKAIQLMIYR